ncbi:MAG: DUF4091 domain-containing protein [Christensenellales bacterium]|jgi:hypothetical protein
MKIELKLVSALTKVFHDTEPEAYPKDCPASLLGGEVFSFQAAFALLDAWQGDLPRVRIAFDCALPFRVRKVTGVPVRFPKYDDSPGTYLRNTPGVYPDLLQDITDTERICLYPGYWSALWIDVEPSPDTAPGDYPMVLVMSSQAGQVLAEANITISLLDARLPEQKLVCSRWLHADSLAATYHLPMFSIEHIRLLRSFLNVAAKRGVNTVFTPIHTPPAHNPEGRERPVAQLVDVFVSPLGYNFRFTKLRDFISLCRHEGIKYFEMSHFYSPHGGYRVPIIMGVQDGAYTRLFGPETEADDPSYQAFLAAYIPALIKELSYIDVLDHSFFHLSHAPHMEDQGQYLKLLRLTGPLLKDVKIIDTLPDPSFIPQDADNLIPIPELGRLHRFSFDEKPCWASLNAGYRGTYADSLIAMPGLRTRILGVQMYVENIQGIGHWALNYYAAESAGYAIDPYMNTDCDGLSPAGDAFLLYPGQGGTPEESMRMLLFHQALQDLRALQGLEKKTSREDVLALINQDLSTPLSFTDYPNDSRWLLDLRHRVNLALVR